jgi:hypothetical protein
MFAVTTILPLRLKRLFGATVEVYFPENVTAVLAFDGTLPGRQKAALMFMTEYSHCCNSL